MKDFILAHSSGKDWKTICNNCILRIEEATIQNPNECIMFVYFTDYLSSEIDKILHVLSQRTGITNIVGTNGIGICATAQEYYDVPALAILVTKFSPDSFALTTDGDLGKLDFKSSIDQPMLQQSKLAIIHGDPTNKTTYDLIDTIAATSDTFVVGGLTSSRNQNIQICGSPIKTAVSGVILSDKIPIVTAHTQSCSPIGKTHLIKGCRGNVVNRINNMTALDALKKDVSTLSSEEQKNLGSSLLVALPIPHSDRGDYLVRHIIGVNEEKEEITLSDVVDVDQPIQFCRRDPTAAKKDLIRILHDLKKRAPFQPKGGLYYSCVARGKNMFETESVEMKIIREELGEIPIAGFFCNGEISHQRIYAYTGVLTLFC